MTIALAVAALVISVASAAASFGLWRAARRANESSDHLLSIERERRHSELTPAFQISFSPTGNTGDDAFLDVKLTDGPPHLDGVVISILDETGQDHWARGLPANLRQEDADLFIWGPWEFNIGAKEQVLNFRTTVSKPYSQVDGRNWDHLHLVRTRAGAWMSDHVVQHWRSDHPGPLRLQFICHLAGYEPWFVPYEIDVSG